MQEAERGLPRSACAGNVRSRRLHIVAALCESTWDHQSATVVDSWGTTFYPGGSLHMGNLNTEDELCVRDDLKFRASSAVGGCARVGRWQQSPGPHGEQDQS